VRYERVTRAEQSEGVEGVKIRSKRAGPVADQDSGQDYMRFAALTSRSLDHETIISPASGSRLMPVDGPAAFGAGYPIQIKGMS
jgi:hypothetical protein